MKPKKATKKNRGGRPTKLNATTSARIVAALEKCAPIETAAALAGISKDTLYAWLKRGTRALDAAGGAIERVPKAEEPYARFSDALQKAMATGEVAALGQIWAAGHGGGEEPGQWQAMAWILERTRHEKYGRRERLQHEGVEGGAPLEVRFVDTSKLPPVRKEPAP